MKVKKKTIKVVLEEGRESLLQHLPESNQQSAAHTGHQVWRSSHFLHETLEMTI